MNKHPFNIVDETNEQLKKYGWEIQIVQHSNAPHFYSVDILSTDGSAAIQFADNYYERELEECVRDAKEHILRQEEFKKQHEDFICYRIVDGWTHSTPALIYTLTEVPLFFYDKCSGTVENVDDNEAGVDAYEDRDGYFCVRPDDYDVALRQIDDHDNRGVER